MITDKDRKYLERAVELAKAALENGHEPFGSLLVAEDGSVLVEMQSQVGNGDRTQHPEFNIARWAAANMSPEARNSSTVYTSCEHCAMCSAAHGWVGLGRIVFACSAEQMAAWRQSQGGALPPVYTLPARDVLRDARIDGPVPDLAEAVIELQRQASAKA